jgi:hypothetical protein
LVQEQQNTAAEQRVPRCFLPRQTVIGQDFRAHEMAMADNLLQKTAKTAGSDTPRMTPPAGVMRL